MQNIVQNIVFGEEFKALLPLLSNETLKLLEANLMELADASPEEIEARAIAIENGTYEWQKPEPEQKTGPEQKAPAEVKAPQGSKTEPEKKAPPKLHVADPVVRYIANGVYADLQKRSGGAEALKTSLRSCIDILDGFYVKL